MKKARKVICKIGSVGCPYHACMGDSCQKGEVLAEGEDWGDGDCAYQGGGVNLSGKTTHDRKPHLQVPVSKFKGGVL